MGLDFRDLVTLLGVLVFALLMWRIVASWHDLTGLECALGFLLAMSPAVASIAQWYLGQQPGVPHNPMQWAVVVHRVVCLAVVLAWPRLLRLRAQVIGTLPATRRSLSA